MKKEHKNVFQNIIKSKFIRSVFSQIILIFMIVIIAIIAIVFFSFTSEIKHRIIAEKQKQLEVIESTISGRMYEITSIAYNVGDDKLFYFGDVAGEEYSGYEMSKALERYLVGNDFIEHLAYYRLSEPDVIYASSGEIAFVDFWNSYMGYDKEVANEMIESIKKMTSSRVKLFRNNKDDQLYLSYVYPLPQFSQNPQAFVLAMIPGDELKPILESQLANCSGEIAVFDSEGNQLYCLCNMEEEIPIQLSDASSSQYFTLDGKEYVMQQTVSEENGWTYVSVICLNDMISGVANKQLGFIVMLLVLMVFAVISMFFCIVIQYKPINALALRLNVKGTPKRNSEVIDEESVLSDSFAVLKDDSEKKQQFEAAFYEAEAANKAKSTFLSNMSHDIRTPMNAIVGMTEIASKNIDNPEYVKECLDNVRISSRYLLDIINNVLDMSRIESGKFTLAQEVVDLPKLTYELITILKHSLEVKSQNLTIEIEDVEAEKFIGDQVRITQVFMNILTNSIKFTPNGGNISLHMSQEGRTKDGYGDYTFIFKDSGVGMSQEFISKVFDTFTRENKVGIEKVEGTGLGMAIAKNFVELMGGTIQCKSELGKGTTFIVKMHLKLAEEALEQDIAKYSKSSVLIIGENQRECEVQVNLFRKLGVCVKHAVNVLEAIEAVKEALEEKTSYEFVVINQTTKDRSGIHTVERISRETHTDMSYVLAAKDLLSVEKSAAVDAGISAFVQIPLFKSSAIGILERTIKRQDVLNTDEVINLSGKRILLVEDNAINRLIANTLISETGAQIVEATNGKEAVDAFKNHAVGYFDIILMDVQMPVMNGYEATAAIRSIVRPDAQSIPIFAMTANTFDEDVRQVKESGMNGHLGKPYVASELYELLSQV